MLLAGGKKAKSDGTFANEREKQARYIAVIFAMDCPNAAAFHDTNL